MGSQRMAYINTGSYSSYYGNRINIALSGKLLHDYKDSL